MVLRLLSDRFLDNVAFFIDISIHYGIILFSLILIVKGS